MAVGTEVADEGVLGEEVEVVLLFFWVLEVVAKVSQAVLAVEAGLGAGSVDLRTGVVFGELVVEAHEGAQGGFAASADEVAGPEGGVGAEIGAALLPVGEALADVDGGASGSEDFGEFSGFEFGVQGDGFHAVVEGLDHAAVVADPDAVADVFGGDVVVGFLPFGVAVAVDAALGFGEAGAEIGRQGLEDGLFDVGEVGPDSPAGGAVDAGVCDGFFPVTEVDVEGVEVGEGFGFEGAFADVADVAFDFAFVLRGVGLGGERDESVVPAEGGEFWVEFGVVEVGFEDAGFEVVEDEGARDPAEVAQGVFEAPDEAFGVLAGHGFGVAFARVAQGDAQEVDFTPLATEGEGGGGVVDLGFFAGFALHAPDGFLGVGIGRFEPGDEAFDRGVAEVEVMLVDEVLPDAFGVEPLGELLHDGLAEGFAGAFLGGLRRGLERP